MAATRVEPRRIRYWSPGLASDVVRGVGFWWRCACGEEGPSRKTYREAQHDLDAHRQTCPRLLR